MWRDLSLDAQHARSRLRSSEAEAQATADLFLICAARKVLMQR